MNYIEYLGITYTLESPTCVTGQLEVADNLCQPFGFLHGGASISLLESLASRATELNANLESELPFGIDVHVAHRKALRQGILRGEAKLAKCEQSSKGYSKMFWDVTSWDNDGNVCSTGSVLCLIVPKSAAS